MTAYGRGPATGPGPITAYGRGPNTGPGPITAYGRDLILDQGL